MLNIIKNWLNAKVSIILGNRPVVDLKGIAEEAVGDSSIEFLKAYKETDDPEARRQLRESWEAKMADRRAKNNADVSVKI